MFSRPDRGRSDTRQNRAQDQRQKSTDTIPGTADEGEPAGVLKLLPPDSVREKQIKVDGRTLAYTATAGTFSLFNQNGERMAAIFYTAYVAKNSAATSRPVTFAFNGGPGAASAYLHLGLVGPRIADFGPSGRAGATPKLRDNPETWLEFTDLVMIDPVATGWSRAAVPDGTKQFLNVSADAESIAKVISLYIANNNRTASPKYLLGESYGGFRAAKVARVLHSEHGILVSGIVMVSPMLETSMQFGRSTHDPFHAALVFPTFVATELDRAKKYTPEAQAEAERFALYEYLPTLAGTPPTGEKAQEFYGKIAQMTNLPLETVIKSGGYIESAYMSALRSKGIQTSSYDASFSTPDPYTNSIYSPWADPVLDGYLKALAPTFVGYAREELGFKTEMTYTLLNRGGGWSWGDGERSGRASSVARPGVSDDLRRMLAVEPTFRLFVAHGRSDLVTPYGVNRYVLDQVRPPTEPGRVQMKTYAGGHMFYFSDAERRAFTADAKMFYQGGK